MSLLALPDLANDSSGQAGDRGGRIGGNKDAHSGGEARVSQCELTVFGSMSSELGSQDVTGVHAVVRMRADEKGREAGGVMMRRLLMQRQLIRKLPLERSSSQIAKRANGRRGLRRRL